MALLEVRELHTTFATPDGVARAVDGVDFEIAEGEMVALVGESGCGKSAIALSLMRLLPPGGRIDRGVAMFEGRDLFTLGAGAMRDVRGRRLSLIFQEPAAALNPVRSIGSQVAEVARAHGERSSRTAWARAVAMLGRTGIAEPDMIARRFSHQLSGGMRQRVLIAMALLLEPALVIADEPTTALDVTIQAQILDLLRTLQRDTGTAVLLITHDVGVVAELCRRVMVMYAGQIVENRELDALFAAPLHPYSEGLLRSIPHLNDPPGRLMAIPGSVPSAVEWPTGCRFHDRCAHAWERCVAEAPALLDAGGGARARCHLIAEPARRVAMGAQL
ncbi:MAG TPA: ABC transporter ATP-binding protein [Gemmatimonadaceae bacterium]|nr:ABC transporter ATP-binding protein [Gemmatimonadaceae bacterium]